MAADEKMQHNADKQEQKGASEDPPTNVTKQNEPGKNGSSEVNVPKEAVENYKDSGKEGEE